MKMHKIAALLMMVTVVACAPSGSQQSPELAAMDESWEKALNSGDMDALMAMYTEDARVLPPNAPAAHGHDAVRASFQGMIDAGLTGDLETVEAFAAADMGYRLGTYTLFAPDGSAVDRGKYIETWKNEGGSWKISNDIWNSDMPPPPPSGSTVIITHEVKDADHWLAAFKGEASRKDLFMQNGVSAVRNFQCMDKPNQTGLLLQVDDMEAFQTFVTSSDTANLKVEDGVKDKTLRTFAEVK